MNSVSQKCVVEATTLKQYAVSGCPENPDHPNSALHLLHTWKKVCTVNFALFFQAKLYFMNSSNSNFDKGTMQIMLE